MSTLVDQAIAAVRKLPGERQDELARYVIALAEATDALTADETAAIAEAEGELALGERVPAASMRAFWRTNGL